MELYNKIYISDSAIHGKGAFALEDINEGIIVLEYFPEKWNKVSWRELIDKPEWSNLWFIGIDFKCAALGPKNSILMRINHSNNPNCDWNPREHTLTSNKLILMGEEITYNYNLEIAPDFIKKQKPEFAKI